MQHTKPSPTVQRAADIVTESHAMQEVMAVIARVATGDAPVLLVGDSGTGKELLAREIHAKSPRAQEHFVAVNCSAIPDALLENQLFGHRRGAFTDAREDRGGLFQVAHRGTILLDEIGDMAPALQGKLLRVLQEKEVHPLGALLPEQVNVRIVAATHRDLDRLVGEGRFRLDLLYRINVITVHVPPLRDRPEDIAPCVTYFLEKHGARLGKPALTISADALQLLRQHHWPGNVRELENVIERALLLASDNTIHPDDLPDALRGSSRKGIAVTTGRRLTEVEREHILRTVRAVAGNKSAAARMLGLDRKTLYRKLRSYDTKIS